jgi:NAD(P)-dependent dehydrogenase (short-subunit alcohol dehydrogenase family)
LIPRSSGTYRLGNAPGAGCTDGSASFAGTERVKGKLAGKEGTFVLQDVGTVEGKEGRAMLVHLPGGHDGAGDRGGHRDRPGHRARLDSALAIADISDRAEYQAMVELLGEYGRWDVLVNNAAVAVTKPLPEFTEEGFDRRFAVNVTPVFCSWPAITWRTTRAGSSPSLVPPPRSCCRETL